MSLSVGAFSVAVAFVSMQKDSQARTRRGSGDLKLAANNLLSGDCSLNRATITQTLLAIQLFSLVGVITNWALRARTPHW